MLLWCKMLLILLAWIPFYTYTRWYLHLAIVLEHPAQVLSSYPEVPPSRSSSLSQPVAGLHPRPGEPAGVARLCPGLCVLRGVWNQVRHLPIPLPRQHGAGHAH